jgi:trimethylamine:corrinoid methyltransferase-like protein
VSDEALDHIHQTALRILAEVGVRVDSPVILRVLANQDGVTVDRGRQVATFSPEAIASAIEQAPSEFTLYGRDDATSIVFSATNDFLPVHRRRVRLGGPGSKDAP